MSYQTSSTAHLFWYYENVMGKKSSGFPKLNTFNAWDIFLSHRFFLMPLGDFCAFFCWYQHLPTFRTLLQMCKESNVRQCKYNTVCSSGRCKQSEFETKKQIWHFVSQEPETLHYCPCMNVRRMCLYELTINVPQFLKQRDIGNFMSHCDQSPYL